MAPNTPPQLSLVEKLDVFPALLQTIGSFVVGLITSPIRGSSGAYTYWQHAVFSAVRTNMVRLSIPQAVWINPTTEQLYYDLCKKKGVDPEIVPLPSGAAGYWMGKKDAKSVIIYYHGGGYVLHSFPGQYQLMDNVLATLKDADKDVSIFWLDYTLAPEKHYPIQLVQAIDALRYILSTGRQPSDIMVGGDSAGGNLTVGVLAHLLHPHPDPSVQKLEISEPLKGAVLISPWISFNVETESAKTNVKKDYCPPEAAARFANTWKGEAKPDNYNEPLLAPKEWWEGLKVKDILITIGGVEMALDTMKAFAKKIEAAHPSITTVILPNEYHVAPAIDAYIGITRESETEKTIKSWLLAKY